MSNKKQMISDALFWVQIVSAVVFCGAYTLRSLRDVTGSSAAQVGLVAMFLVFNLALGIGAHRAKPSRGTRQLITTYAVWLVLVIILIGVVVTNSDYRWNEKDTTTLVTAMALTIAILVIGGIKNLSPGDPMMKGYLAIAYKSVPQILLAWKFLTEGASGTPAISVWVGHATILVRLGQVYFTVKEDGWDRNRLWLAISETANEVSWIVVTIVWLIVV